MGSVLQDLLNDFGDLSDEENGEQENHDLFGQPEGEGENGDAMDLVEDGNGDEAEDRAMNEDSDNGGKQLAKTADDEDAEERQAAIEKMELGKVEDVRNVLSIFKELDPLMQRIQESNENPPSQEARLQGRSDDNPEYKLLQEANAMATKVDGEMIMVHKWLRDHFSKRFPELEQLIVNSLDYARAVAVIGNASFQTEDLSKKADVELALGNSDNMLGKPLKQLLDKGTIQAIVLAAVYSKGSLLSPSELANVNRACEIQFTLNDAKDRLSAFAESRMSIFAPNLTCLIGTLTATQLINTAGGITQLAATPATNLIAMGNKRKTTNMGMASNIGVRNQGFIYNTEIVQNAPKGYEVQAMRMLSAKIALAARQDLIHDSRDGEAGLDYYDQIIKRLSAISKVPDSAKTRALPAPDDKPARKRGGRRARKAKEATAMTDLRKAQNRMAFGKEEAQVGYGSGDSTMGMGMIGQNDGVRGQKIDQRTRAKLSKKNQGWGGATSAGGAGSGSSTALRSFGAAGNTGSATQLGQQGLRVTGAGGMRTAAGAGAGTASTIAFTPAQGLELVDPRERDQKRKRDEESKRKSGEGWFSSGISTAKVDAGGFKIPALPMAKKQKTEK